MEPLTEQRHHETNEDQERLLSDVEKFFQEAPLAYKRIVASGDILMVMGGLKAGTDRNFIGDTYNETDYQQLEKCFGSAGLRIEILGVTYNKHGFPFREGVVYNPRTLEKETASSRLVLPYKNGEAIHDWAERCRGNGQQDDAILGKFFSFPESAIRGYIRNRNYQMFYRLLEESGFVKKQSRGRGNEVYLEYLFLNASRPDVAGREVKTESFLSWINSSPRFMAINESQTLKDSDAEWLRRLPDNLKRE